MYLCSSDVIVWVRLLQYHLVMAPSLGFISLRRSFLLLYLNVSLYEDLEFIVVRFYHILHLPQCGFKYPHHSLYNIISVVWKCGSGRDKWHVPFSIFAPNIPGLLSWFAHKLIYLFSAQAHILLCWGSYLQSRSYISVNSQFPSIYCIIMGVICDFAHLLIWNAINNKYQQLTMIYKSEIYYNINII